MSMYEQGGEARAGASGPTQAATDKMQEARAQVSDKLAEVREQAGEQLGQATSQAQGRAREQIDRRTTDAGEQVTGLADIARRMSSELREQGKDPHAKLADQLADNMQRAGDYLKRSDADTLLGDIEDFGRRQPVAMAAGGLVLGLLAARFLKASSSRRYERLDREAWRPQPALAWDTGAPARDPYALGEGRTGLALPTQTESAISGRGY